MKIIARVVAAEITVTQWWHYRLIAEAVVGGRETVKWVLNGISWNRLILELGLLVVCII